MNVPRAKECMTAEVVTCDLDSDMERAAHLMWTNDCGVLPVVNDFGHVVGVVTDRDLAMGAYTQGRALRDLRIADCMSKDVLTCLANDSLEDVIRGLGERKVHRMPVVDDRRVLQGILSISDIVRRVESMDESILRSRLETLVLSSMAQICEPRRPQPEALAALPARASRSTRAVPAH